MAWAGNLYLLGMRIIGVCIFAYGIAYYAQKTVIVKGEKKRERKLGSMKRKHVLIGIAAIIILITALWLTGVIPKMIGKQTAISYVKENYSEIGLTYQSIEFSTVYDDYIVSFSDEAGAAYNFRLSSKYFPTSVAYDSIKQSNVD